MRQLTCCIFFLAAALPVSGNEPPGILWGSYFSGLQSIKTVGSWWSIFSFIDSERYGLPGTRPFTWQWYHDGVPIPRATNSNFRIVAVGVTNGGRYSVVVSNPYGSSTNREAFLTVFEPSVRVSRSWWAVNDPRVYLNANIGASSDARIRIQWYKDGAPIPGATNLLLDTPLEFSKETKYRISIRALTGFNTDAHSLFDVATIPPIERMERIHVKLISTMSTGWTLPDFKPFPHPVWRLDLDADPGKPVRLERSKDLKTWETEWASKWEWVVNKIGDTAPYSMGSRFPGWSRENNFIRGTPCCMPYPEVEDSTDE